MIQFYDKNLRCKLVAIVEKLFLRYGNQSPYKIHLTNKQIIMNMKKLFCVFFTLSIYLQLQSQSDISVLDSKVEALKIFHNGALVTRSCNFDIATGINKVTIRKLSPYINAQTIQVKGNKDASIVTVNFAKNFLSEKSTSPQIKPLQAALQALKDSLVILTDRRYVLSEQIIFLNANRGIGGNNGIEADQLDNVLDVYTERITQVRDQQTANSKMITKLEEQLNLIQAQIKEFFPDNTDGEGNIVLTLNAAVKGKTSIEFSYYVDNASWRPVYDLYAATDKTVMNISLKAYVQQHTGEIWKDAKVTFVAGTPYQSGDKPNLETEYVDFFVEQPRYKRGGADKANGYGKRTYSGDSTLAFQNDGLIANYTTPQTFNWYNNASANSNRLNYEYVLTLPQTINSDGEEFPIEISKKDLNVKYAYSCIPKITCSVFLIACVNTNEAMNLPSGTSNLFLDNNYMGETYFDTQVSEDNINISFGTDSRIVSERKILKEYTAKKFMSGSITKTYDVEITIHNNKSESANINLEDQIPLSSNSQIVIESINIDNAISNIETGKLTWNISMQPNEVVKKHFTYSIKYPKGKRLNL